MALRRHQAEGSSPSLFLAIATLACIVTYFFLSPLIRDGGFSIPEAEPGISRRRIVKEGAELVTRACCRGIEKQELWGSVVKWGSDHKVNSSAACCEACKAMCTDDSDSCKCDSWVFCGDRLRCGSKYGECWLKKQDDPLYPDVQDSSKEVFWTSGLVFGKNQGIVGLETKLGTIHIKLLPDCAPLSVAYIVEILKLRHCAGCHFYRAEGRGDSWDKEGNPVSQEVKGPPYALLQGIFEPHGYAFRELPKEACPDIKRGMVGWVGGGPDFFISLANHKEWHQKHTVFASVIPEDLPILEKLVAQPTTPSTWNGVKVAVLEEKMKFTLLKPQIAVKSRDKRTEAQST